MHKNFRSFLSNQAGSAKLILYLGIILTVSFLIFEKILMTHSFKPSGIIKSGISGYCLDDYKNATITNNKVSAWKCNNSSAQEWVINNIYVQHGDNCLTVENNSKKALSIVALSKCNQSTGQIWLSYNQGLYNPNSMKCLYAPKINSSLEINSCINVNNSNFIWLPNQQASKQNNGCNSSFGAKVACSAEAEWAKWQSGKISHINLLNNYSDQASYEEWCADFVSYNYKIAGRPFTEAYNGWDENNANNIKQYNFTLHNVGSGYVPKAGDVAFFDYPGGHVEIVIHGGNNPTFIYGNSGINDPQTGNGDMATNTITTDGNLGSVIYYLTPN